jgi:hypothetical protein
MRVVGVLPYYVDNDTREQEALLVLVWAFLNTVNNTSSNGQNNGHTMSTRSQVVVVQDTEVDELLFTWGVGYSNSPTPRSIRLSHGERPTRARRCAAAQLLPSSTPQHLLANCKLPAAQFLLVAATSSRTTPPTLSSSPVGAATAPCRASTWRL